MYPVCLHLDVDECSIRGLGDACVGDCTDTEGSYLCSCPTNFVLGSDRISCEGNQLFYNILSYITVINAY